MLPFLGKQEEIVSFFLKFIPFGFAKYSKVHMKQIYDSASASQ